MTGVVPDRVTSDGHSSYPRAIACELGEDETHRTNQYLNNHLGQDHRGIKQRVRPMLGFKRFTSAARFCLAIVLQLCCLHHQPVFAWRSGLTKLLQAFQMQIQRLASIGKGIV